MGKFSPVKEEKIFDEKTIESMLPNDETKKASRLRKMKNEIKKDLERWDKKIDKFRAKGEKTLVSEYKEKVKMGEKNV